MALQIKKVKKRMTFLADLDKKNSKRRYGFSEKPETFSFFKTELYMKYQSFVNALHAIYTGFSKLNVLNLEISLCIASRYI